MVAEDFSFKTALPYEKPRLQAVKLANQGAEPLKMRSELETGRRLAFVLEQIARGEVKAKMPKDTPLLDDLKVPSQIASHCGSSKVVDENREPQAKTEPSGRAPSIRKKQ